MKPPKIKRLLTVRQITDDVEYHRRQANKLLNKEIEQEMYALMHEHPGTLSCILKCMGEVTLYGRDGRSYSRFHDEVPRWADRVLALADLDIENYCTTGNPLKLYRGTNGQVLSTRDW